MIRSEHFKRRSSNGGKLLSVNATTKCAAAALLAASIAATAAHCAPLSANNNNNNMASFSDAPAPPFHFILSADDGTYSGTHEQKYVLERTTITQNFTAEVPFCQSAFVGIIDTSKFKPTADEKSSSAATAGASVNAILVTTGIGAVTAALCTQQAAQWVQQQFGGGLSSSSADKVFTAAYFMGTSGWSPFVGGLNPKDVSSCGVNRTNSALSQRVSVGSVCVSPISYDVDCGFHVEDPKAQGAAGMCDNLKYSETWGRSDLFGTCAFSSAPAGGVVLADALKKATPTPGSVTPSTNPNTLVPKMDAELEGRVGKFWAAMQLGKGAPNFSVPTTPFITTRCGEAVSHSIWVGAQMDYQCRVLTGKLLSAAGALKETSTAYVHIAGAEGASSSSHSSSADEATLGAADEDSFVCTSAMEGYGFLSALTRALPRLPAVIIRGASNYDMYPLFSEPSPYSKGGLYWQQDPSYVSPADEGAFSSAGYHYAIQTTNQVLLNFLATLSK